MFRLCGGLWENTRINISVERHDVNVQIINFHFFKIGKRYKVSILDKIMCIVGKELNREFSNFLIF